MTPSFTVRTTSRFDRLLRALHRRHTELAAIYADVIAILSTDPYNRSRQHRIRKLEHIRQGEGEYRLAIGRWRFRYDLYTQEVVLHYCGLRREDTYR
jgi:hypothetical protein